MLKCSLVTKEIESFVSESVDYILEQMDTFSKLAGIMSYLKLPLNFSPGCTCCLVEDDKMEKYILCFTDSCPTKENFLSLGTKPKFSYGFTSCVIYLAHYCLETNTYKCTMLSSYNKLSTPNWDILRTEGFGPALASKRVALLAQIFRVPNEKILFFMDNLPFLCLIRNFEKNYLTYKIYFVKLIQELLGMGFLKTNFYYVSTNHNYSDLFSRPAQMLPENIGAILGSYKNGKFDLISPIFGHFDVKRFILSTNEEPPEHLDTSVPGIYESRGKVFLNLAQSMSQFTNIFRDGSGCEPIKALKALTSLNKSGENSVCHPSFVRTKNNGVLYSE